MDISTDIPYREVYDRINQLAKSERQRKYRRSTARGVVYKATYHKYLINELGWQWQPTMQLGEGCKVHLRDGELPYGRLIVSLSRHLTAVVYNVIYDNHDPSRNGTRCVYGYFHKIPTIGN